MSPHLAVVHSPPSPRATLAGFVERRRTLARDAADLATVEARLNGVHGAENEALAAIGELGAREIAETVAWASQGALGDPPTPHAAERRKLAQTLADAQARTLAAKGALGDVAAKQIELAGLTQANERAIENALLAVVRDDFEALAAETERDLAKVRGQLARLAALYQWVVASGRDRSDRGDVDSARPYFSLGERLPKLATNATPSVGEVSNAEADWTREIAALLSGAQP